MGKTEDFPTSTMDPSAWVSRTSERDKQREHGSTGPGPRQSVSLVSLAFLQFWSGEQKASPLFLRHCHKHARARGGGWPWARASEITQTPEPFSRLRPSGVSIATRCAPPQPLDPLRSVLWESSVDRRDRSALRALVHWSPCTMLFYCCIVLGMWWYGTMLSGMARCESRTGLCRSHGVPAERYPQARILPTIAWVQLLHRIV